MSAQPPTNTKAKHRAAKAASRVRVRPDIFNQDETYAVRESRKSLDIVGDLKSNAQGAIMPNVCRNLTPEFDSIK